jgi:hypothetical protein
MELEPGHRYEVLLHVLLHLDRGVPLHLDRGVPLDSDRGVPLHVQRS